MRAIWRAVAVLVPGLGVAGLTVALFVLAPPEIHEPETPDPDVVRGVMVLPAVGLAVATVGLVVAWILSVRERRRERRAEAGS